MKFVLYVAAGIEIREGMEHLVDPKKESSEDYVRRILEVLKTFREEKQRKKEEKDNRIKWSGSAGEKEESEKNEGGEEGEQMKLYPQSGLMEIHSDGLSDKEQRQKIKGEGDTE